MQVLIVFFVAALSASSTLAEPAFRPPLWGAEVTGPLKDTMRRNPVKPLQLGKLRIVLENTRLLKVRAIVGAGEVLHYGDAGDAIAWLCYTNTSVTPMQRLWLTSSEMGGGETIDGISATVLPSGALVPKECPALPSAFLPVRLSNGLWLGASARNVKKLYGAGQRSGQLQLHNYSEPRGEFELGGTVAVQFVDSKTVAIHVAQVTSN